MCRVTGHDPTLPELLTPEGRALVDALTPYDPDRALAALTRMRRESPGLDGELLAAAATQARLRTRAAERFPGPPRWWTAEGLEQATRPQVAARHAQRYVRAGLRRVVDLCAGVGSDALAFAAAGLEVTAVDWDRAALWALAATAGDLGLDVDTREGDVRAVAADLAPDPATGVFVDPARRRQGARTMHPEQWSPPWSWVLDLAGRVPATGAKVAPGIPHDAVPADAQVEWVSVRGELVEAGAWWGPLRLGTPRRVATVLTASDYDAVHLDDAGGVPPPTIGPIGRWLAEPDPAVIRAGLVSVLAEQVGGRLLDPRIAYVTVDDPLAESPLYAAFEVLDEVPFARKPMRAWLRARGVGDVVVKKRGVAVVPEELRASLRLSGDGPTAILVLTRTAAGPVAWHVRRPAHT